MTLLVWCMFYVLDMLYWLWILKFNAVENYEGTLLSWLLPFDGIRENPEYVSYVKFFGWFIVIGHTIWFIMGLFIPKVRFVGL